MSILPIAKNHQPVQLLEPPLCSPADIPGWNARVEWELKREYQFLAQADSLEVDKPSFTRRLPSTFTFVAASTVSNHSPSNKIEPLPCNQSLVPFSCPRLWRAIPIAVAVTIVSHIPAIYYAAKDSDMDALCDALSGMVKRTGAAAALAGLGAIGVEALERVLRNTWEKLTVSGMETIVTTTSVRIQQAVSDYQVDLGRQSNVLPAVTALYCLAVNSIRSLYHAARSAVSSDREEKANHLKAAKGCWNLDAVVRLASSSLATYAASVTFGAAAGGLMAGPIGVIAGVIVFAAINAVTEYLIDAKEEYGGYIPWIRSCIWPAARPAWRGIDSVEMSITPNLICPISHRLV
jgi:hypothetical protein